MSPKESDLDAFHRALSEIEASITILEDLSKLLEIDTGNEIQQLQHAVDDLEDIAEDISESDADDD